MNTLLNTATVLSLLIGVVIPHLSALLSGTKAIPAWAGGYITLVLAAVTGFLSEWAKDPNHYDWQRGALNAGVALLFAVISHYGVLRSTPVQAKLLAVGSKPNHTAA